MPFKTLTKWKISKKITLSPKGESECNIYLQITLLCSFFFIIIPTWSIFFRLQNWWGENRAFCVCCLEIQIVLYCISVTPYFLHNQNPGCSLLLCYQSLSWPFFLFHPIPYAVKLVTWVIFVLRRKEFITDLFNFRSGWCKIQPCLKLMI